MERLSAKSRPAAGQDGGVRQAVANRDVAGIACVALLSSLVFGSSANPAGTDVGDWREMWVRCLTAIETAAPVDTEGLVNLGTTIRFQAPQIIGSGPVWPLVQSYAPEQRWGRAGAKFAIVETESEPRGGQSRSRCDVELIPTAAPITPAEELQIAEAFIEERERLVASGKYEVWDLDPIASTHLGLRPRRHNSNGCRVVSALLIETRAGVENYFTTLNGEQEGDCGSEPRFPHRVLAVPLAGTPEALLADLNDGAATNAPVGARITGCLSGGRWSICQFSAYSGVVGGQFAVRSEDGRVQYLAIQVGRNYPQSRGLLLATAARLLQLIADEMPAELRRKTMLRVSEWVLKGGDAAEYCLGDIAVSLTSSAAVGTSIGLARRSEEEGPCQQGVVRGGD